MKRYTFTSENVVIEARDENEALSILSDFFVRPKLREHFHDASKLVIYPYNWPLNRPMFEMILSEVK